MSSKDGFRSVTLAQLIAEAVGDLFQSVEGDDTSGPVTATAGSGRHIAYNPLRLSVGDIAVIKTEDGKYDANRFEVYSIVSMERSVDGEKFSSVDYVLIDTADAAEVSEGRQVLLRVIPQSGRAVEGEKFDLLLLTLDVDSAYNQDVHEVLKAGGFPIPELEESGYARPAGLTKPWETRSIEYLADEEKISDIQYWDFVATANDGKQLFYFIEMDTSTGWFQTFSGARINPEQVDFLTMKG